MPMFVRTREKEATGKDLAAFGMGTFRIFLRERLTACTLQTPRVMAKKPEEYQSIGHGRIKVQVERGIKGNFAPVACYAFWAKRPEKRKSRATRRKPAGKKGNRKGFETE